MTLTYFVGGEFRGAPTATTVHDTQPLNRRSGSGHGSHHGYSDGPSHTENTIDDFNDRYKKYFDLKFRIISYNR